MTDEGGPAPKIDTSVPHSARIWNYWLGGKDNYPVDREAGDKYRQTYPQIVDVARAGRYFLARAVRFLAGERRRCRLLLKSRAHRVPLTGRW